MKGKQADHSAAAIGLMLFLFLRATFAWAAPPDKDYSAGCTTSGCHEGLIKKPVVHTPAEQGACDTCHEPKPKEKHAFKLKSDGAVMCNDCHEADKFQGKVVHNPVSQGQCTACHDPHATKEKKLIRFESTGKMCAECHEDTLKDLKFVHGPAAAGECTACHAPHVSAEPKLVRQKEPPLCLDCHSDVGDAITEAKHKHPPVESSCLSCHKPHGAANALMLADTAPKLCNDCHEEVMTKATDAKCKHSPVTADNGCMTCHAAHASAADKLLKQENSAKMCLSCHNKPIKSGEHTLMNIAEHLQKNRHAHGPIGDGSCMPCHEPHGADRSALLAKSFPSKFYAPYSADKYELCFDCHDAEAFATAQGGDTGFRNGDVNLHYLHVNKEFKGRTCRVCHDPHASNNDKHIRESAPFGQWNVPINFQPAENGGSCGPGCHSQYRYDRIKAATNAPSPMGHPKLGSE